MVSEILNKLNSEGALYRCQGIIECVRSDSKEQAVVEKLNTLRDDRVLVLGRPVGSYAKAALCIMGIENNDGDEEVAELIEGIPQIIEKSSDV